MTTPGGVWTARLMKQRYLVQRKIIQDSAAGVPFKELIPAIDERRRLEDAVAKALKTPSLTQEDPALKVVPAPPVPYFAPREPRLGFTNELEELDRNPELAERLEEASFRWLASLNSEELAAAMDYSNDSSRYAQTVAEARHLHEALHKAPRFSKPVQLYSGVSGQTRELILPQVERGVVTMKRAVSTSCNPAQVNGFMHNFGPDNKPVEGLALEIEAVQGGSLISISHSPHEFEVLLPPGNYQVVGEERDVSYLWPGRAAGGELFGRTAARVLKLRQL
jgi:hypothetical protein